MTPSIGKVGFWAGVAACASTLAYDIVQLLARAIEEVGADRRAVRDYLGTVGGERPAFDGVTGRIAFDSAGDVPRKAVVVGVVRNGRLVTEASQ